MSDDKLLAQVVSVTNAYIGHVTADAVAQANRIGAIAKPFLDAWAAAIANSSVEFVRNSHEWRITSVAGTLQSTSATPCVCNVNVGADAWAPVDSPIAIATLHKALGIKVPEKSKSYVNYIGYKLLFDCMARVWIVRSEMPASADTALILTVTCTAHYKSIDLRQDVKQ
jgi:hypothetical protein